jgi:hypothetical protein
MAFHYANAVSKQTKTLWGNVVVVENQKFKEGEWSMTPDIESGE